MPLEPGLYHDDNAGVVKRIGANKTQLKTSAEIVAAVVPQPEPSPVEPLHRPLPLRRRVIEMRACSGTIPMESVIELATQELEQAERDTAPFDSELADIARERAEHFAGLDRLAERALEKQALAAELRDTLVALAETRRQVDTESAALADAKAKLASADCLTLDEGALLRLSKVVELKPVEVAELRNKADTLANRTKELLAKSKVDGEKLLSFMKERAGYSPGKAHVQDSHVHGLFQSRYLRLPD